MAQENTVNLTSPASQESNNRPVIIFKSIKVPNPLASRTFPDNVTFDDIFPDFSRKERALMPTSQELFTLEKTQEFNEKHKTRHIRPAAIASIINSEWKKLPDHDKQKYVYSSHYISEVYDYRFKPFTHQIVKF